MPIRCELGLLGDMVRVLSFPTMAMGIRFSNGNANGVTATNFLSRLWGLIDDEPGLMRQIVA
jgi:hypothetical protein